MVSFVKADRPRFAKAVYFLLGVGVLAPWNGGAVGAAGVSLSFQYPLQGLHVGCGVAHSQHAPHLPHTISNNLHTCRFCVLQLSSQPPTSFQQFILESTLTASSHACTSHFASCSSSSPLWLSLSVTPASPKLRGTSPYHGSPGVADVCNRPCPTSCHLPAPASS